MRGVNDVAEHTPLHSSLNSASTTIQAASIWLILFIASMNLLRPLVIVPARSLAVFLFDAYQLLIPRYGIVSALESCGYGEYRRARPLGGVGPQRRKSVGSCSRVSTRTTKGLVTMLDMLFFRERICQDLDCFAQCTLIVAPHGPQEPLAEIVKLFRPVVLELGFFPHLVDFFENH